jgi:RibD C-terminal domain
MFWENPPDLSEQPPFIQDYAAHWRAADKVVYSTSLQTAPTARTRIERAFDPEAVRRLKAEATEDLTIGGPELAANAIAAALVDEYQLFLVPVLVGGGKRALPDSAGTSSCSTSAASETGRSSSATARARSPRAPAGSHAVLSLARDLERLPKAGSGRARRESDHRFRRCRGANRRLPRAGGSVSRIPRRGRATRDPGVAARVLEDGAQAHAIPMRLGGTLAAIPAGTCIAEDPSSRRSLQRGLDGVRRSGGRIRSGEDRR